MIVLVSTSSCLELLNPVKPVIFNGLYFWDIHE